MVAPTNSEHSNPLVYLVSLIILVFLLLLIKRLFGKGLISMIIAIFLVLVLCLIIKKSEQLRRLFQ